MDNKVAMALFRIETGTSSHNDAPILRAAIERLQGDCCRGQRRRLT